MKRLILYICLLLLFSGCTPATRLLEPPIPFKPTDRIYPYSFDSTWTLLLRAMQDYPIAVIEKSSGIVDTDWTMQTGRKHIKVWRGLLYGGYVEDYAPYDYREKFHVLVMPLAADCTHVKIKRFVELRYWTMLEGESGSWTQNNAGGFRPGTSTTVPENVILNRIETTFVK